MPTTNLDALALESTLSVGGAATLSGAASVAGAATFASTVAVTGALSLTVPLTKANANESLKRVPHCAQILGTYSNGATYRAIIPITKAGTIKAIRACANVKIAGGTNTLAVAKKQGGTSVTVISTATVDPTAFPVDADTAEAFTLTATAADLVVAAGDCLIFTLVCGTMTTAGQNYAFNVEIEQADV